MPLPNAPRWNQAALVLAVLLLGRIFLFSPHYQGWRVVRESFASGALKPLHEDPPFGGDFLTEWFAGYIIRRGECDRLYDPEYADEVQHDPAVVGFAFPEDRHLYLFYPPAFYLLVAPLSGLPLQGATLVWLGLMAACLVGAVFLLSRFGPRPPVPLGVVLLAALCFGPLLLSLQTGQKGTFWLLLFAGTYCLLRRERPFGAGLVFGLVILKPPLGVAVGLVMLWKRQFCFVAGCAVTVLLALVLSLALGQAVCASYLDMVTGVTNFTLHVDYPRHAEHGWYGFFSLSLFGVYPPLVIRGLALVLDLVTLGILLRLFQGRIEWAGEKFTIQFAGLVLATVLISPKLLTYDLTLILLPIYLLARLAGAESEAQLGQSRALFALAPLALFLICSQGEPIARCAAIQVTGPVLLAGLVFLERSVRPVSGSNPQNLAWAR